MSPSRVGSAIYSFFMYNQLNIHIFLHITKYFYKNMQIILDKAVLSCIIILVPKIYGGIYYG